MSQRLCCYTLFNITQTGVMNRSRPQEGDTKDWVYKRNTQCNFDTLLQVISLRSQPDVIKIPQKVMITNKEYNFFGSKYKNDKVGYCWRFEFEIQHASVFSDEYGDLSALYNDCNNVPMIRCEDQHEVCPNFLNTSSELKNIYFEVL